MLVHTQLLLEKIFRKINDYFFEIIKVKILLIEIVWIASLKPIEV